MAVIIWSIARRSGACVGRRSCQVLCSTPLWPGWAPVTAVVWLASVAVGSDAIAPRPVVRCHGRAMAVRLGASPESMTSSSRLALQPSRRNTTTWSARSAVQQVLLGVAVLAPEAGVGAASSGRSDPLGMRVEVEDRGDGRRDVHGAGGAVDRAEVADAGAGGEERSTRLHDAERAVLAQVIVEVVIGSMRGDDVGGVGGVEELGDRVEGVRIGVLGRRREAAVAFEIVADEAIGGLVRPAGSAPSSRPGRGGSCPRNRFVGR